LQGCEVRAATRSSQSITGSIPSSCAPTWQPAWTRCGNSQTGQKGALLEHREGQNADAHARGGPGKNKDNKDGLWVIAILRHHPSARSGGLLRQHGVAASTLLPRERTVLSEGATSRNPFRGRR